MASKEAKKIPDPKVGGMVSIKNPDIHCYKT